MDSAAYSLPNFSTVAALLTFRAMASSSAREQFLRQMEQIVEGIKQNRMKVGLFFSLQKLGIWGGTLVVVR